MPRWTTLLVALSMAFLIVAATWSVLSSTRDARKHDAHALEDRIRYFDLAFPEPVRIVYTEYDDIPENGAVHGAFIVETDGPPTMPGLKPLRPSDLDYTDAVKSAERFLDTDEFSRIYSLISFSGSSTCLGVTIQQGSVYRSYVQCSIVGYHGRA